MSSLSHYPGLRSRNGGPSAIMEDGCIWCLRQRIQILREVTNLPLTPRRRRRAGSWRRRPRSPAVERSRTGSSVPHPLALREAKMFVWRAPWPP